VVTKGDDGALRVIEKLNKREQNAPAYGPCDGVKLSGEQWYDSNQYEKDEQLTFSSSRECPGKREQVWPSEKQTDVD